MPNDSADTVQYEPIFVARQPIFTGDQEVWGYELLFRHSDTSQYAQVTDNNLATSRVIADGFTLALHGVEASKRMLINFPAQLILDTSALALPKDRCVIEILETVEPTPEIIAAISSLKEEGYVLALDDYVGQPGFEEIIALADILKVEVLGMPPNDIMAIAKKFKGYGCKLLAEKVEDAKVFQLTKSMGFELFQGYYFSKPEIVPGRKIPASVLAKLQLMQALSNVDCDFDELSAIIEKDLSLSYRLLKFINSSAFALRSTVNSLAQAITLLGLGPFKRWALVVLMSDMDSTPKGEELIKVSLERGRFLEQVSKDMENPQYNPDTMFLLGLFSMLDALLGQPMEDVLADMPLEEDIKKALLGEDNPARTWLQLLEDVEGGNWEGMSAFVEKNTVQQSAIAVCYLESSSWALETLDSAKSG